MLELKRKRLNDTRAACELLVLVSLRAHAGRMLRPYIEFCCSLYLGHTRVFNPFPRPKTVPEYASEVLTSSLHVGGECSVKNEVLHTDAGRAASSADATAVYRCGKCSFLFGGQP